MKKVHSKNSSKEKQKETPLHFKIEVVEDKAHVEMHGRYGDITAAICSVMQQKPDFASIILKSGEQFLDKNLNTNTEKDE